MKVNILIPNAKPGAFSDIKLCYSDKDENDIQVSLNIDFKELYEFTGKRSGVVFDLFLLGCCVYGIDVLLVREDISVSGWSRVIEVEFPVESPEVFNNAKQEITQLLSFLTGDEWTISFVNREVSDLYIPKPREKVKNETYRQSFKSVSLFSGGLDSLIGVINQLFSSTDKIVLASHYDGLSYKGAKKDQDKTLGGLSSKYTHYHHIQTRVDLSNFDTDGRKRNNESTLRSRSFLFICQAVFIAHSIADGIEVFIPENGTISLNYPLTPSRRSSCSTRTAHPYYLRKFTEVISKLGLNHRITNKYEMCTKGEMVESCLDRELLLSIYSKTGSCAKRGRRPTWDLKEAPQCGVCMPCIYRRVALHRIGKDNEIVGTDFFNPQKYDFEELSEVPALIDYLTNPITKEDIKRNLLVNGSLPLEKLEQYAEVVYRTRNEIKDWIRDKSSDDIKNKFGV